MVQEQTVYPAIDPVPEGAPRPFWSVMIPTYNCADLLRRTLKSVLEQDPGPEQMQIEVIDDYSTKDDPEAVVNEMGKGRASFFRQPQNVGPQANFTTCIQRSRGQWVHILHGDDMVLPGYYQRLREAAEKEPSIGAAFCRYVLIDEYDDWQSLSPLESRTPGILQEDYLERLILTNHIMFPAISVKRSVYEKLGGFHPNLFHSADWDMWVRIFVNYPIWYEPELLALYRWHASSDSSRLIRTGANTADARACIEGLASFMPTVITPQLIRKAREFRALMAIELARNLLNKYGSMQGAMAQIREGLKCSRSPVVAENIIKFTLWAGAWWVKQTLRAGSVPKAG